MFVRLVTFLIALTGAASAQEASVQDGNDLYLYYCAECHGKAVGGIGPTAEFLAIDPPDLTRLAIRNGGEFPLQATAEQIDGRRHIPREAQFGAHPVVD